MMLMQEPTTASTAIEIQQVEAGTFRGMTRALLNEAYHGAPGLSSTQLITAGDGFDQLAWKRENPKEMTAELSLGQGTHLLLEDCLNGTTEATRAIARGQFKDRRSKAYAEWAEAQTGNLLLLEEEYQHCNRMVQSVLKCEEAMRYLRGGLAEASVFVDYPGTKTLVKCRPDYLIEQRGLSVNFKTCQDASYNGFIRSVADWGYDWQSAFYIDVLRAHYGRDFDEVHILVEKNKDGGPCRVGVYSIDDEDLDFARAQYRPVIEKYQECLETNVWPAPTAQLQIVKLPAWSKKVVIL